MFLLQEKE